MPTAPVVHILVLGDDPELYCHYAEQIELKYHKYSFNNVWDWGFDLFCPSSVGIISEGFKFKVPLNVVVCVTYEGLKKPYAIFPRSSIGNSWLTLTNSVGIIDPNYNGLEEGNEDMLCALFTNHSSDTVMIKKYQRLVQLVLPWYSEMPSYELYDKFQTKEFISLTGTASSRGGFGTSGV